MFKKMDKPVEFAAAEVESKRAAKRPFFFKRRITQSSKFVALKYRRKHVLEASEVRPLWRRLLGMKEASKAK